MSRARGTRAGLDRAAVVAAAHDILVVHGLAAVTMRSVADLLEVAPNTLYSHVADREDLIDQVLETELAKVRMPPTGTTEGRLETTLTALWYALVARPGLATHFLTRTDWTGEATRLASEIRDVIAVSRPTDDHAAELMGALLAYTIGSAAMEQPMGIELAEPMFHHGLSVFLTNLELEPAPGRFTVIREWPSL
jgi:TetR/AcrR family tetracycline transcriptional repressor